MNIIFVGVFYYGGPVRHLYRIFEIYKAIAKVFKAAGINVKYFTKQNEVLPLQDTLTEDQFNARLSECDLLFMWNGGLGKEKEIAEKCRAQGTPVYYAELGWLPQRGTFYFDRKGVNYASTITDWQYKPLTLAEGERVQSKLLFYHKRIAKQSSRELNMRGRDFVFVPLQVESDSQIKQYSPNIKTMQDLVDCVCQNVPGEVIFKPHPREIDRPIKVPDRCKIFRAGTTHDFLPNCKYVITINSTVGVEALTYNKPVVTLGQAFYGGKGITYNVIDDREFKNAILWANKGEVAIGRIEAFLYYLFERQWYSTHLNDPEKILGLIEGITDGG